MNNTPENRKKKGYLKPGRKVKFDRTQIKEMLAKGMTLSAIARELKCSVGTIWMVRHNRTID